MCAEGPGSEAQVACGANVGQNCRACFGSPIPMATTRRPAASISAWYRPNWASQSRQNIQPKWRKKVSSSGPAAHSSASTAGAPAASNTVRLGAAEPTLRGLAFAESVSAIGLRSDNSGWLKGAAHRSDKYVGRWMITGVAAVEGIAHCASHIYRKHTTQHGYVPRGFTLHLAGACRA